MKATVGLSEIKERAGNRSSGMSAEAIATLAASIAKQGLLVPLLVRPVNGHYELVDGARRLAAMRLNKVGTCDVTVLPLGEDQVDTARATANLAREGLSPLEEAEIYAGLMKARLIDAKECAALVGRHESTIRRRLALTRLAPKIQKMLADGKIALVAAEAIAKLVDHKDQEAVLAEASDEYSEAYQDIEGMDATKPDADRAAFITEKFIADRMRRLGHAPFDTRDASLVPKAGACFTCPFRTGAEPLLFPDTAAGDRCTRSSCWDEKVGASAGRAMAEAKKAGYKVLGPDRCKGLFDEGHQHISAHDGRGRGGALRLGMKGRQRFVRLDGTLEESGLVSSNTTGTEVRTVRAAVNGCKAWKALNADALKAMITVVIDPDGRAQQLMPTPWIAERFKELGMLAKAPERHDPKPKTAADKAKEERAALEAKIESEAQPLVIDAIAKVLAKSTPLQALRLIVQSACYGASSELKKAKTAPQLIAVLAVDRMNDDYDNRLSGELAKVLKVNVAAIVAPVRKKLEAAAGAATKKGGKR